MGLTLLEAIGNLFCKIYGAIVYETREDSVTALRKLSSRELSLNDVIKNADKVNFGDPEPKFEVWISPSDFEYEEKIDNNNHVRYGVIKFKRKISYIPKDHEKVSLAFVSHSRTVRFATLRSRSQKPIINGLMLLGKFILRRH